MKNLGAMFLSCLIYGAAIMLFITLLACLFIMFPCWIYKLSPTLAIFYVIFVDVPLVGYCVFDDMESRNKK